MPTLPLVGFTRYSGNRKTGPIAVSTSGKPTCPDACPLKKNGCYAAIGKLNIHWDRVTRGDWGLPWGDFLKQIRRLHPGELWRHNQAGDLAGDNNKIDAQKLRELTSANKNKRVICYSHYPVLPKQAAPSVVKSNIAAIVEAVKNGFTINLSANGLAHADKLFALKIAPVAVILPHDATKNLKTPAGNRVVVCPASVRDNVTCSSCGLCARANREYIIGFPAHSIMKKKVSQLASIS